ncbi:UvrD-helicase domain-containing protein [Adlercreutzia sp. ZJ141]|uniref:UvrD-helicase domain-containing protein n=1 Tax=Adlercreutzia sp. ZJ141 TaxID=2709406 RepID=UPI0013EC9593|nr:UvrD-helicase domain-containing protein [Adlercreutzia sp. ZJ141]
MNLDACTPEQRRSIQHIDGPLVVSAGAGSGKTFTLTQRIAYALLPESGPAVSGIDEVLAITFTEKAAAEIKARVKRTLRAEGLADEALLVDGAWISTIHGMCSRILHAHALELNLDPSFGIVSEEERSEMIALALDEALGSNNEIVGSGAYARLLHEYGARQAGSFGTSVLSLVTTLLNHASGLRGGMSAVLLGAQAADAGMLARELLVAFEDVLPVLEAEKDSASCCKARAAAQQGVLAMQDLLAQPSGTEFSQLAAELNSIPWIGRNFGSRGTRECVTALNQVRGRISQEVLLGLTRPLQDELICLATDVAARYERKKAAAGKLDNDDLLSLALRALEENPSIAQRYEGRFKLVMVDEFQDTSQLQIDLIARLAGENAQNLCTVGDAQQSIYRFRGADVNVYERHREHMRSSEVGALYVEMNRNFRSHRSVLALVDRIFEQPCMFGSRFMSLAFHEGRSTSWKGDVSRIDLLLAMQPAGAGSGVSTVDVRRANACAIAQRFAHLKACGHAEGDMVVLLRKMTNASVYADALREAGLSCVVAGGSRFADAPEVRIVCRALQALANPASTDALFEVLSSEMFELSADDFLRLGTGIDERHARYVRRDIDVGFDALRESDKASLRLAFAKRTFSHACQRLRVQSPSDALRLLIVESGWMTRLEGKGAEGLSCAANVLKAVRLVEDIEAQGTSGIAKVSRAFASMIDAGIKQSPGALSGAAGNAVRIMTVHTSKGLEFPIVAVAEFDTTHAPSSALVTGCEKGRLSLSLTPSATAKHFSEVKKRADKWIHELSEDEALAVPLSTRTGERLALERREAAEEAAEAQRLLYVALTRASESLIIAMMGKEPSKGADAPSYPPLVDAIRSALCGAGDFPCGETTLSIGSGEVARFQRFTVTPPADAAGEPLALGVDMPTHDIRAGEVVADCETVPFQVPNLLPLHFEGVAAAPYGQASFFSYTSLAAAESTAQAISDASHAAEEPSVLLVGEGLAEKPAGANVVDGAADTQTGEATRLGSAFHRAAQFAIETGQVPDKRRVRALARTYGLTCDQINRLHAACERWFQSDTYADALSWPRRRAEVPFVVCMNGGAGEREVFLEGEIDLLCTDAEPTAVSCETAVSCDGAVPHKAAAPHKTAAPRERAVATPDGRRPCAFVVDYKTGGTNDENADVLHAKHELQATCYAYALLRQGFWCVELRFVRVERDDGQGQPQTVCYRFEESDLPSLERTIRRLYQKRLAE